MPHITERIATIYWLVLWLTIGFGVPEGIALATGHPEFTLSDTAWRILDVLPGQTPLQYSFLHLLVSFLLLWLWAHITFGLFR